MEVKIRKEGVPILVEPKLHKELSRLKVELGKKSFNELLWELLISYKARKK